MIIKLVVAFILSFATIFILLSVFTPGTLITVAVTTIIPTIIITILSMKYISVSL